MTIRQLLEKHNQLTGIKLWDNELNGGTVDEILSRNKAKYYFKCERGLHESNLYDLSHVSNVKNLTFKCRKCNSFGQQIVDKFGQEFLDKIWSDKNDKLPFDYSYNSYYKVWFNCENQIHESYQKRIDHAFLRDCRCPECSNLIHPSKKKNLIGQKFGRLTVIDFAFYDKKKGGSYYICNCDCGKTNVQVYISALTTGKQISCGCYRDEQRKGENNPNWKGGITSEATKDRNSKQYIDWRNAVYQRDNYVCQCCGAKGGRLNAHHIKSFANYPELRFNIDNGITLCETCHSWEYEGSLHNIYGSQDVTPDQLFFYIKQRKQHIA